MDAGIYHGNNPFVIGKLDFEVVGHRGDNPDLSLQLAIHIDPVPLMQVELVIVIGKAVTKVRKLDLHHGLPRYSRPVILRGNCVPAVCLHSSKTAD